MSTGSNAYFGSPRGFGRDVLLPVITTMINLSFESGEFASDWKEALLKPLLKKCGLDIAFNNFRPVSNLPYVSKLSEKAAANQLIDHMTTNDLAFAPPVRV